MKHCVYILYSKLLDKFYVGETEELEERLEQHYTDFQENLHLKKRKAGSYFYILSVKIGLQ